MAVLVVYLTRTSLRIAYNFEFITALSISAGLFFKNKKFAILVPLVSLFISDLIIGNTNIYIFTWSGFLMSAIVGIFLDRILKSENNFSLVIGGIGSGVVSTIIFFLWTNLGVVLQTTMYSKDLAGLTRSYINAIPFLQNQLIGNVILVPVFLVLLKYLFEFFRNKTESRIYKELT